MTFDSDEELQAEFVRNPEGVLRAVYDRSSAVLFRFLYRFTLNNSGGGFEKAVETAELFVPNGKNIVSTKNRDEKTQDHVSKKGFLKNDVNVILVTNAQTSSGAELFAGALKESLGAKLVGENTFGKWNAQTIQTLSNGFAIKYSTLGFQTPAGRSYQNVGLKPDVEVTMPKNIEARELRFKYEFPKRLEFDPQLKAAFELLVR